MASPSLVWHVAELGPLQVTGLPGQVDHWPTQHCARILAYLAWHLTRPHAREALVELHWPGVSARVGRQRLSVNLTYLRRLLEPNEQLRGRVVLAGRDTVALNPELVFCDAAELRARAVAARAGSPDQALAQCEEALAWWRGPFLDGLYAGWAAVAEQSVQTDYLSIAERVVTGRLADHRPAAALAAAQQAVTADPGSEAAWRLLLEVAAGTGDRALASEALSRARTALATFDLAPSDDLVALADSVAGGRRVRAEAGPLGQDALPASGTHTLLAALGPWRGDVGALVQAHRGRLLTLEAGAAIAAFGTARDALACLTELGRAAVRSSLHTAELGPGSLAEAVATARRLAAAAAPAQVLASQATAALLAQGPAAVTVSELGSYRIGGRSYSLSQLTPAGEPVTHFAPPAAERDLVGVLPVPGGRFYGRQMELAQLARWLDEPDCRLLTITGPGGAGKTRLALELSHRHCGGRGEAVWFVPLAAVRDGGAIAEAIVQAMQLPPAGLASNAFERLAWVLRQRPSLLVLDNLEQLAGAAGSLLLRLLARAPHLRCLATSRHRLGVPGERELPLGPLPLPAESIGLHARASEPAVALFADRAAAARATFALHEGNANTVAALCRRLDGLPLAIELAAARVGTVPPERLLEQLDRRYDWAAPRGSHHAERHRTLRRCLGWSYELLSAPLQQFARRVAVLRGTFTAAQADAVLGEPMAGDLLAQLVGYSLVGRAEGVGEARYALLPTIRQYLWTQLSSAERVEVAQRQAAYYLAEVATLRGYALPADLLARLDALGPDLPNVWAALDWAAEHDLPAALAALAALSPLWEMSSYAVVGYERLRRVLARTADAPAELLAAAWAAAGRLAFCVPPVAEGSRVLAEAEAHQRAAGDHYGALQCLVPATILAITSGDEQRLTGIVARATELAERIGTVQSEVTLNMIRSCLGMQGTADAAMLEPLQRNLELCAQSGDAMGLAMNATQYAILLCITGRSAEAGPLLELPATQQLAESPGYWGLRTQFARAALAFGRHELREAAELLNRAVRQLAGAGTTWLWTYPALASGVAAAAALHELAITLASSTAALLEASGYRLAGRDLDWLARMSASSHAALPPAAVAAATARGARLTGEQVIDLIGALADTLRQRG